MQTFHFFRILRQILALAIAFAICGCGVNRAVEAIGDGIGEALGCALSAGFDGFSPAVSIQLKQVELDSLVQSISEKKISNENQFWGRLDSSDAIQLKNLVSAAYYNSDPSLQQEPESFYENLLAYGLIQISQGKYPDDDFTFNDSIGVRQGNTVTYTNYTLEVVIPDAPQKGQQDFSRCDVH